MRFLTPKTLVAKGGLVVTVLLLTAGAALAQVKLTAQPTTANLPDGQSVPMWGLFCAVGSNTNPAAGPTCTALTGAVQSATVWQPPLIRATTGSTLTISLTNGLPSPVPTSLMIVGQIGGGLGTPTKVPSPTHAVQGTTWPIANAGPTFTPPPQPNRIESFGTEVGPAATANLTWPSLKAGTYLIESGTHPSIQGPMGLYGVLVVSDTATEAYPGVAYDADVPLLLSEIDANQNQQVATAVATAGFSETSARVLRDSVASVSLALDSSGNPIAGTGYHVNDALIFTGGGYSVAATAVVSSVSATGAITGITVTNPGQGYSAVPTVAVSSASGGSGAQVVAALTLAGVQCSDGAAACYPPAVNYDPRYYLVNGVAFDKTNPAASTFAGPTGTAATGDLLVRFVNAGLRMHVPSVVGQTMALIAEDGNVQPDVALAISKNLVPQPKLQSEVFLAAGKVFDVKLHLANTGAAYTAAVIPVFDRQLSLSTNNERDGGMHAYISVAGAAAPAAQTAVAVNDHYYLIPGQTLTVADPSKGVIANDTNVYGVRVLTAPTGGVLTLNADGTFAYVPNTGTTTDTFVYQANGNGPTAQVLLDQCTSGNGCLGAAPVAANDAYVSRVASRLQVSVPGVLANDTDPNSHPLTAVLDNASGATVTLNPDGSFTAAAAGGGSACTTPSTLTPANTAATCYTFTYHALNSQGTASSPATVTLYFLPASNLQVHVYDAPSVTKGSPVAITDYRWIIEEDRTFYIDPACQQNGGSKPATCPTGPVPSLGTNFFTSFMPVVAEGCVGTVACEAGQTLLGAPAVCDVGNGACRTSATQETPVDPSQVYLDPTKRYYISVLPGDAANTFDSGAGAPVTLPSGQTRQFSIALDCPSGPGGADFAPGTGKCGHTMGGANIAAGQASVTVKLQETPLPTASISAFVFEDDFPLNGENDAGGGVDVLASQEPGLGGFALRLFDQAGALGDATGQITYDMFNMPVSNSLAGQKDALTGLDACPISPKSTDGLVGVIVTCPKYESDGKTLSPLAGQAVIANLYQGLYEVVATPGADRIARGEEWLQTNTLDGTKPHEAFIRPGEPAYFQEFGPAGYHVAIGFANPAIINARLPSVCASAPCQNSITGKVTTSRISRTPDQRLYSSATFDGFSFTQCYVSVGDPDGEDFAFTKCNPDGTFSLSGIPDGSWRITVFDEWNDILVDGLSTPVALKGGQALNMGDIQMQAWRTNVMTRTFIDTRGTGVSQPTDPGLPLVSTNIRYRDGSFTSFNKTDLNGFAPFNEVFPFFNWLTIETDTTRYKQTGVHVVYDAGGPADGTPGGGTSTIGAHLANTLETIHLPANLRVPGAVYCDNGDCNGYSIKNGPASSSNTPSTGRIDPPWATSEGWQGFMGEYEFLEFGKQPYAPGENGGIKGHVVYSSTRPFDDPTMLIQDFWEPLVPGVTVNLYKEGTAADGTETLKLIDTTKTSSWDDWAQGFRSDGIPNMNCPGQDPTSPFYFTLQNTTQWLYPGVALPDNSQFKCYDGMAMLNQVQPAPYDGMYQFPSVTGRNPTTGAATGTNCTGCVANPVDGTTMLPAGKYVVEVVVPPGYELVKEEDKNILIGDNYIAPVTQQFGALNNIFIIPDQASVNSEFNPNNPQNPTQNLANAPHAEGDTGSVEEKWPCVGQLRTVPDFISLFPGSREVSPFAGASRHLCDRKEVTLADQSSALAKFYIFTSTHAAGHYTGIITDDFASEFDPYSPQFGEKFAVPNLPVSFKDYTGVEISRTYTDQWGLFNGLTFSTWEVNPPNPTGYAPTVMIACMNDPGPIPDPAHPGQMMTDPNFNPGYSQFCYEIPFMPAETFYMDTPVVPTMGFAEGYNPPDCAYPNALPAIKRVDGDGAGPWLSAFGHNLTITALGDQLVANNSYSGPQATTSPYNLKSITRHYGFGSSQGAGSVTIGGVNASVVSWSDSQIVVRPSSGTPACAIQQQGQPTAYCGELVITAGNGIRSIDTVTVTIGGKAPTYINGENAAGNALQAAIDNATPGDLLMIGPGLYKEMLLMWKPVRLQGVGAASVVIDGNPHPAGKLDAWRRQVNCLFGLALDGQPISASNPYDSNPVNPYVCPTSQFFQVDRVALEGIVGWDTTTNGNLAELLQEPTLMGAYEGATITVLGKGVRYPAGATDIYGTGAEAGFPAGTVRLTSSTADCAYPGNFLCNPSRIDGLTITDSSQGGGGIFIHGWNHYLEVSNDRVFANAGTLSGGISVGQGEFPDANIVGDTTNGAAIPPAPPNYTGPNGTQLPYYLQAHVNIHNNSITQNASYGDELYSATPAGAGGVTIATGSDEYHFNYNWVCGNLSSGDGGGVAHLGFSYNGDISHNTIIFNQSTNPTIPTEGGGLLVSGAAPDGFQNGTECGSTNDIDCPPGLSDGTGPGLVIDSNLILGNNAESGSGGGLRLQLVNGTEVSRFPTSPSNWYQAQVQNNIIVDNVAGWDGAGVSLQDALAVNFVNNSVISNDTTASAGVLFDANQASLGSTPPPGCDPSTGAGCTAPVTTSANQAAGLVTMQNTPNLIASLPASLTCPTSSATIANPYPVTSGSTATCKAVSLPVIANNVFWQNRAFHIQVGGLGAGLLNQQNTVGLIPMLNQSSTGQCVTGATYWDIGVRGDTSPSQHSSGFTLNPVYNVLTDASDYSGKHDLGSNPLVARQYCDGSRVPPENGGLGYEVPPGISDATSPNPIFNLTPAATVDEGNNWINMSYGPLSLFSPGGVLLGQYIPTSSSPTINAVPFAAPTYALAPKFDFFNFPRKTAGPNGAVDMGAVEYHNNVSTGGI